MKNVTKGFLFLVVLVGFLVLYLTVELREKDENAALITEVRISQLQSELRRLQRQQQKDSLNRSINISSKTTLSNVDRQILPSSASDKDAISTVVIPDAWPLLPHFRKPIKGKLRRKDKSFFVPTPTVPVGPGHDISGVEVFPLWGEDFLDESTKLLLQQPHDDPYDHPEDADKNAKPGSIWQELVSKYKNAPISILKMKNQSAMCLISAVYTGNCKYLDESFAECAARLGPERLEKVLSEKCRVSDVWPLIRDETKSKPHPDENVRVKHGGVPSSELCFLNDKIDWVPPEKRLIAPFGGPRHCRNGAYHYPIAFGTPSITVQTKLFPKLFDFHPIPVDVPPKPLTYNDEDTYQALAALSHFCITHARGGWDCGRHYEVMGAGCVPYFYDILAAGPFILPQLPRKFLVDVVKQPALEHIGHVTGALGDQYEYPNVTYITQGHFNARSRVRFVNESFYFSKDNFDYNWYWKSARQLLKYTQKYLTTESMAAYVLKTMNVEHAKHVLILTRNAWDNLHQAFITGLDGLGIKMTIVQENDHAKFAGCYRQTEKHLRSSEDVATFRRQTGRAGLHGSGVPWANRMRNRDHKYVKKVSNIWDQIEFEELYDAAIFTYFAEDSFPLGLVMDLKAHTNGKVAVFDHSDSMGDPRRNAIYLAKEVYFFSRELRRVYC